MQVWTAGLETVLLGLTAVPLPRGFAENRLSKEAQQENCDIPLLSTLVLLSSACSWNVEAAPACCLFLSRGRKITWSTKAHSLPGSSFLLLSRSKKSAWMFYESAMCSFQRSSQLGSLAWKGGSWKRTDSNWHVSRHELLPLIGDIMFGHI